MLLSNSLLKWQTSPHFLLVFSYTVQTTHKHSKHLFTVVQSQRSDSSREPLHFIQKESRLLPCPFPPSENTACPFHRCHIHLPLNCPHTNLPQYCDAIVTIKVCQAKKRWGQRHQHGHCGRCQVNALKFWVVFIHWDVPSLFFWCCNVLMRNNIEVVACQEGFNFVIVNLIKLSHPLWTCR